MVDFALTEEVKRIRDMTRDFARREAAAMAELRHFDQRFESGIDGRAQTFQSQPGEDPVFPGQGHCVRDGGDGHYFHERLQQAVPSAFRDAPLDQTLRQFERDPGATQRLARILAT